MFKATIISSIFAAAACQVSAEPVTQHDLSLLPADVAARVANLQQYGDRFQGAIEATLAEWSKPTYIQADPVFDLSALPIDVAERVAELQKHGDRFEPAIRAILAEAGKPSWTFDGCSHQDGGFTLAVNQS